jgi:uncharacterized protein YodC (DUF2158 family)
LILPEVNMSGEIALGDVVRLKSGGPKMTVVAIDVAEITEEPSVWCEWFDEDKVAKSATFSLIAVEKVAPRRDIPNIRYGPSDWMA